MLKMDMEGSFKKKAMKKPEASMGRAQPKRRGMAK
jgi:hypothetical protein